MAILMALVLLAALPLVIMMIAPLLIVLFIMSRILGPGVMWIFSGFWALLRAPFGGGGHGHRQHSAVLFRVRDEDDRIVAVQLRTHSAPLELGDHVVVDGVRIGGLMRAARVANTTTGQTVYAPAFMVTAAVVAFFFAITLISLLSSVG